MYAKNQSSFVKCITTSIPTFLSGVIGYALFSEIEGKAYLHQKTLGYLEFFFTHLNFFDLGFALALASIILIYFYSSYFLYFLFDLEKNSSKNNKFRSIVELYINVAIGVGFSGFALAIFSPYLEFTRETYNYYNIMLGINVMLIALASITTIISIHFCINSEKSPIPFIYRYIKDQLSNEVEYNSHSQHSPQSHYIQDDYEENYSPRNVYS